MFYEIGRKSGRWGAPRGVSLQLQNCDEIWKSVLKLWNYLRSKPELESAAFWFR